MDHEIRSSRYPYPFTSWCMEKTESLAKTIANALETVKSLESKDAEKVEDLINDLSYIANLSTSLFLFCHGEDLDKVDTDIIAINGYRGYEELTYQVGLIKETTIMKKERFIAAFKELIKGEKYPNRTLIYDLINDYSFKKDPIAVELLNLIEQVTMGEREWDDFVKISQNKLNKYEFNLEMVK